MIVRVIFPFNDGLKNFKMETLALNTKMDVEGLLPLKTLFCKLWSKKIATKLLKNLQINSVSKLIIIDHLNTIGKVT